MSYDVTKVSKVGHLKAMALRAEAKYATKKSVTDLADRIDSATPAYGLPAGQAAPPKSRI